MQVVLNMKKKPRLRYQNQDASSVSCTMELDRSGSATGVAAATAAAAVDQRLWHGCVPVVFSLHPSEVTTLHAPRPFYVSSSIVLLLRECASR